MQNNNGEKQNILTQLRYIKKLLVSKERSFERKYKKLHPSNLINAKNLTHYLTLRTLNIRQLQDELHKYGLSSLAISESHMLGQINAILRILDRRSAKGKDACTYEYAAISVEEKISGLFGPKELTNERHIMVTIDSKWLDNYSKFETLLKAGMNIARINCAYDDQNIWLELIENIRKASDNTGIACKIYMDLAGPKIRTLLREKMPMPLSVGQRIILASKAQFKRIANKPAMGCSSIKNLSRQLKEGEQVYFDDGLIKAVVKNVKSSYVVLEILSIASKKEEIKHGKGINFPDSTLRLRPLTTFDRECLPFISEHADIVGYSFVRNKSDIKVLRKAFKGLRVPPIVVKIENYQAVYNLPSILFEIMKDEFSGIMIARGDLAIEIGFEKMSEIQDEILWICEAAHIPVIWATQVLENLNKKGIATRSEITDAAKSSGADCVMLNKGKNIVKTLKTLKNIFRRMGDHQYKKRFIFRPLSIAKKFIYPIEI